MDINNFLANVYFGSLNLDRVQDFEDVETDEKSGKIIDAYLELTEKYPPSWLEEKGSVPPELIEDLKTIGFFGLSIPEEYGGAGLDLHQYLKVVEETAGTDLALGILAVGHLSIGTKGIVLFGNEKQKERYLVPAASGELIFSYALTEPKHGSDAKNIETTAILSEDGSHYVLNGQKTYITNANYAGALTVFAQLDPGNPGFMGAFIVETSWQGVKIGKDMPKMGLKASSTAAIQFENVRVPQENLLGEPGDGFKIAMIILNYGRLALGATSAGMMRQCANDMMQRAKSRTQFGSPISQYELIQEKIVRAKVHSYIASAMTLFTAGMLVENASAPVAIESSHCKLFGTTRAWNCVYDALQVAGGSGYLATQPYEKRMRDFRVTTIFEGTTEIHSIYPPMFVMRDLNKHMESVCPDRISRFKFLLKGVFTRAKWKPRFSNRVMNRAARLARANARSIRWMIYGGLLLYGKKLSQKQFFLRRITYLSLYLYGILSVLAKLEAARKKGKEIGNDIRLLAYFMEEARLSRKSDKGLLSSRKEAQHKKVFKAIS
jgi:acyl-CoA dehydrogenase family protein 9